MKKYSIVELNNFVYILRSDEIFESVVNKLYANDKAFKKSYKTECDCNHFTIISRDDNGNWILDYLRDPKFKDHFIEYNYIKNNRYKLRELYYKIVIERSLGIIFNTYPNMNIYLKHNNFSFVKPLTDDLNYDTSKFNKQFNEEDENLDIVLEKDYLFLKREVRPTFAFSYVLQNNMCFIDVLSENEEVNMRIILSDNIKYKPNLKLSLDSYEDNLMEFSYFYGVDLISYFKIRDGEIIFE